MAAPEHDWYLKEWIASTGTTQAALAEITGFSTAKLSKLVNGGKRYDRDVVNALSRALYLDPFELLMHPQDAHALRRLRENALRIASESHSPFRQAPAEVPQEKRATG